jgi:hypothetical protein
MRGLTKLSGFIGLLILIGAPAVLAALPSTSTYQLNSYGFGSGGTANSGTSTYSLEGITGEVSGQTANTSTYQTKPGFNETQQANVPKVTLTNPSNYYDKLKFVIDQQNNPTDAKYALQIKAGDVTCNFSTGTINYVKSDNTVGSTLTLSDYQTYTTWGGASGYYRINFQHHLLSARQGHSRKIYRKRLRTQQQRGDSRPTAEFLHL